MNDIGCLAPATTLEAMTFCDEEINVIIPPQFPLQAIPNKRALLYGSFGSKFFIIGSANERVSVVEATFESKDAENKLININTSNIVGLDGGK